MIVAETGTSQVGAVATKVPKGAYYWTQAVWGSIGYALAVLSAPPLRAKS